MIAPWLTRALGHYTGADPLAGRGRVPYLERLRRASPAWAEGLVDEQEARQRWRELVEGSTRLVLSTLERQSGPARMPHPDELPAGVGEDDRRRLRELHDLPRHARLLDACRRDLAELDPEHAYLPRVDDALQALDDEHGVRP